MQRSFAPLGLSNLGKRTLIILSATLLALTPLVGLAPPASASQSAQIQSGTALYAAKKGGGKFQNRTDGIGVGGITNWTNPNQSIIYNNQGYNFVVQPWEWSDKYRADTDGFYIGPGFCATQYIKPHYGGWNILRYVRGGSTGVSVKIADYPEVAVYAYRC